MRKYDPTIHHRRSVRLRRYDYNQEGAYFITICAKDRKHLFGKIIDKEMYMNKFGEIVYKEWEALPDRWEHIELGAFQIMPNHMHGILVLGDPNTEGLDLTDTKIQWALKPTVGQVVGAYCSCSQNACLKHVKENEPDRILGKIWQRNFHEHIIRHQQSFDTISNYIIENPKKWKDDRFFS